MTLTPADIEQKTFSTALRGYNLDEVDDFLDEIVRTMRKLHEDLDEARSARPTTPAVVAPAPAPAPAPTPAIEAPVPPPRIDESAVGKALVAAQETADRILADARSEADTILQSAQAEADTYDEERQKRKDEANAELTRIDGLVTKVKGDLSELAATVGVNLDQMSSAIDEAAVGLHEAPEEDDSSAGDNPDEGSESPVTATGPDLYDQDEDAESDSASDDEIADHGTSEDDGDDVDEVADTDGDDDGDDDGYFNYPADGDDDDSDDEDSSRD